MVITYVSLNVSHDHYYSRMHITIYTPKIANGLPPSDEKELFDIGLITCDIVARIINGSYATHAVREIEMHLMTDLCPTISPVH